MSSFINTNIMSLQAQQNLTTSQGSLSMAMQRLSSGLRINSAQDDPAGYAIAQQMTTQVNGLGQAVRNASNGISLAQTAQGALTQVTNNLQNIRELAVEAANATNSSVDRAALDQQVQQDLAAVDQIATTTSFNGQNVLDGSFGQASFQVGANVGQTISIGLNTSMRTSAIGQTADYVGNVTFNTALAVGQQGAGVAVTPGGGGAKALSAGDLTIAVGSGQAVSVGASAAGALVGGTDGGQAADSAYAKAAAINTSGVAGLTATADTTASMAWTNVAANNAYTLKVNGTSIFSGSTVALTGSAVAAQVNANSGATGVTATFDSTNSRITFNAADGSNIEVTQNTATTAGQGLGAAAGTNNTANTAATALTTVAGTAVTALLAGSIRLTAAQAVTIGGPNSAFAGVAAGPLALGASALNSISVTTAANANTAITKVDAALAAVNSYAATLGAISNRFQSTISNLQTGVQNITAARSTIQDADFAAETANLTRAQILTQAGTAILAQANSAPQSVLTLLK